MKNPSTADPHDLPLDSDLEVDEGTRGRAKPVHLSLRYLGIGARHAPENSTIMVRADTLDGDELLLSVIDQGEGVTIENLGHMFNVGCRADTSPTTNTGGAGLGLAIVRGIVEAQGGRVEARHTEAGFRLNVILPAA